MELLILDESLRPVSVIDEFESLLWTDRYCSYGDFELYTPISIPLLNDLKEERYLWYKGSEHVMIVEDREIKSDVEDGIRLIVTGRSLESVLDRRVVWSLTVLDGNFQNGIKKLIDESIVSPTIANRKIPNFIFEASTDPAITSLTVQAQLHGESLYDAIQRLCESKNLGFKVTLRSDNVFVFKLYSGVNRSYDQETNPYVVFSPKFENLLNSNYVESTKMLKTVSLVAGEGEGAARKTTSVEIDGGGGSGLSRREMFVEASDISSSVGDRTLTEAEYNAQLAQRGKEALSENIRVMAFDGQTESSSMFVYGRDFFMGDIVQIANEFGLEAKSRVVELIHSQDLSGFSVYPTFSAAS